MDFLPIFVNIKSRNCLVVGGGEVAARKIALLLRAGAQVTVVAPKLCVELTGQLNGPLRGPLSEQPREQPHPGTITHRAETFRPSHLNDVFLAIAATDDPVVNREVSEAAGQMHIPVNVVDNPDLCSFIMPSIIDRSPVMVAVSSGGTSPVLARLLRTRLETMIPAAYGRLAACVAAYRERVKLRF
nr:siroheme synthase [Pseudomonadota bacterium]